MFFLIPCLDNEMRESSWDPSQVLEGSHWIHNLGVFTNYTTTLAAQFTSANSEYLSRASEAALQPSLDWTMAFWFKATDGVEAIVSKYGTGDANIQFLAYHDGSSLHILMRSTGGAWQSTTSAAAGGTGWHFAIMCWRDAERKATLYIDNGAATQGAACPDAANMAGNSPLEFGRRITDGLYYGKLLSRVQYWGRDLTSDERTSLYNSGNGKLYAELTTAEKVSLKAAWDMTEASGTRVDSHAGLNLTDNNTVTSGIGPGEGPASDGDNVKRWEDQLSAANHMTADTSGGLTKQPIYLAGKGMGMFTVLAPTGEASLRRVTLTSTIARADFSAAIIWSPNGANNTAFGFSTATTDNFGVKCGYELGGDTLTPFVRIWNGTAFVTTTIRHRSRDMWLSIQSTASALKLWSNDGQTWTGTALAAAAMERFDLCLMPNIAYGDGPAHVTEMLISDGALSDSDQAGLNAYLESQAPTQSGGLVVVLGDSLSWGTACEDSQVWHERLTGRSTYAWRSFSSGGFTMQSHMVSKEAVAAMATAGTDIALIYLGTNDLIGGRTAAQLEADLQTYSSHLRSAGFKTIVFTIQDITGVGAARGTFNTALRANWSTYADAIADIAAETELSDDTNTTYYAADGVHLKKAAHVVIAEVVEVALATL